MILYFGQRGQGCYPSIAGTAESRGAGGEGTDGAQFLRLKSSQVSRQDRQAALASEQTIQERAHKGVTGPGGINGSHRGSGDFDALLASDEQRPQGTTCNHHQGGSALQYAPGQRAQSSAIPRVKRRMAGVVQVMGLFCAAFE